MKMYDLIEHKFTITDSKGKLITRGERNSRFRKVSLTKGGYLIKTLPQEGRDKYVQISVNIKTKKGNTVRNSIYLPGGSIIYLDNEELIHRDGGPAIEDPSGHVEYWEHGTFKKREKKGVK